MSLLLTNPGFIPNTGGDVNNEGAHINQRTFNLIKDWIKHAN
jgi:hypothetical protein